MSAGRAIRPGEDDGSDPALPRFPARWLLPGAARHAPRRQPGHTAKRVRPTGSDAPVAVPRDGAVDLVRPAPGAPLALAGTPGRVRFPARVRGPKPQPEGPAEPLNERSRP